jgi:predicted xylose isomerase-like sugar epimerase
MNAGQRLLDNGYKGVIYFDDFDDALISVTHDEHAVYDYDLMVDE